MCKCTTIFQHSNIFSTKIKQNYIMTTTEKQDMLNLAYETALQMGLCATKSEFADLLKVNRSGLSSALNGNEKYLTDSLVAKVMKAMQNLCPKVSVTGSPNSNVAGGNLTIQNLAADEQAQPEGEMIPVIPINIYKESEVNIAEYIKENDVHMSPAVKQFPKTTCFYTVATMAMYPHFHQGDILALKEVRKSAPIINGEVYAVDTVELGILVRFIYDRGDSIEMRCSENSPRFESFTIKKEDIYGYYRVVGLVRTNI